jgi:hypothetical protein
MKSLLLYNLYLKGNWDEVTKRILTSVQHDDIAVHLSFDWYNPFQLIEARRYLEFFPKIVKVITSTNTAGLGEVKGFDKLRSQLNFDEYSVLTYCHSKGVTKSSNSNIRDWVELMRYFVIDRMDLCKAAFSNGYLLYGVNIGVYDPAQDRYGPYRFSDFHYSGNFVSVNLSELKTKFLTTPCDKDYFGVEGFWGKLCDVNKAFCAHLSSLKIKNHYNEAYPANFYRND